MKHKPATDTAKLGTERRNRATQNLDRQSALEIARIINAEDAKVAPAVKKALPQIARAVDAIAAALSKEAGSSTSEPEPVDASARSMPPNVHQPSTPIPRPYSS